MLFARGRAGLGDSGLEQVRFSSEDLFVLLGGFDTCSVAVNEHRIAALREVRARTLEAADDQTSGAPRARGRRGQSQP